MPASLGDRLAGAVWGHLVGDALGVPYEFKLPPAIGEIVWGHQGTHRQPPGTWSDDGGLMLALLDSLLSVGFDLNDQGARFLGWRDSADYKPADVFDVGSSTNASLDRIRSGTPAERAGGTDERDNGNGSLMRILPVALVGRALPGDNLVEWACRSSSITHGHPRAQVCCAVYCLLVRRILDGQQPEGALSEAFADAESCLTGRLREELLTLRGFARRTGDGYVLDCFWSAWDAFHKSTSYEETVVRAIKFGRDTDTTAAVAGGLAGASHGIRSIPSGWLRGMRGQQIVNPMIERLLATVSG